MGIDVCAKQFLELHHPDDLFSFSHLFSKAEKFLILGGGSNVLFQTDEIDIVVHPVFKGITIIEEDSETVVIKAMAGESWDDLVAFAVKNNWGGLENLSLIPGLVGACPIQNIGAYGVEVKDVIQQLEALNINTGKKQVFDNIDCGFEYRSSVFKTNLKGKYLITAVTFKLNKNPKFNASYGDVSIETEKLGGMSLQNIRQAIINIRTSKLPDPLIIGNAGSFFKNPTIDIHHFSRLIVKFPSIKSYKVNEQWLKIPAGWLIEQCGFKGYKEGRVGVHENQALILINLGGAKGSEIIALAEKIQNKVWDTFEIKLEMEVNII